jgi:mRNA-degrading endonuclease YafQ of YafQ-DinJ toxin-antitoxin module
MQTFLPFPDFQKSVEVLDYRRLGKQRVETFQVLNVLLDRTATKGWRNHPVVRMWRGYEDCLKKYQNITIAEWIRRGYNNNMEFEVIETANPMSPNWLGDDKFHKSHRSNLLRKNYEYYIQFFDEPTDLEYYWPA